MEFQLLQDIPNCMWELFIAQALHCLTVLDFRDDSVDLEVSFSIFTVRAFKATLQPKKPKYDPKSMDIWAWIYDPLEYCPRIANWSGSPHFPGTAQP